MFKRLSAVVVAAAALAAPAAASPPEHFKGQFDYSFVDTESCSFPIVGAFTFTNDVTQFTDGRLVDLQLHQSNVGTLTKLILPTDGLWRGAVWSLEPSIVVAAQSQLGPAVAANPFFAAAPPPAAYVIWAIAWIAAILALAIWSFRSREV